jgi:hypothetical protein
MLNSLYSTDNKSCQEEYLSFIIVIMNKNKTLFIRVERLVKESLCHK